MSKITKTIRLKVKKEAYNWLNNAAIETNIVWNWAQETRMRALKSSQELHPVSDEKGNVFYKTKILGTGLWLSEGDIVNGYRKDKNLKIDRRKVKTEINRPYGGTLGATKSGFEYLTMKSINLVVKEYVRRCKQFKKTKLRWRISSGPRRSLGWIPFQSQDFKKRGKYVKYSGKTFRVFESHKLDEGKWCDGCFSQDSVGDWWLCLPIVVEADENIAPGAAVGIDLGLKDNIAVTTKKGNVLPSVKPYRRLEEKVKTAQRRGHKHQAKRLNRKIANQRKDNLHKFTRKIVNGYQEIYVGDVSSSKLVKRKKTEKGTRNGMGKSVNDAGWYMLKQMLQYKGEYAGRTVEIVNESFTTQACCNCGCLSGPKGLKGLVVREWTCVDCGTTHNRDRNAAKNILRSGRLTAVSGNDVNSPNQRERLGDEATACLAKPLKTGNAKTTTLRNYDCDSDRSQCESTTQ